MSDHKLQALADSALLKVLQYAVTGLLVPFAIWFANRTLGELDTLKSRSEINALQTATFELRVKQLEAQGIERGAAITLLREQVLRHDFELRRLQEERDRPAINRRP